MKSIHDHVCVSVVLDCVLRFFVGVSGVLGKLFGLHRHERIAYMLFSRKPLKVSDMVRHRLRKTLDLGALGESFFVLLRICGGSCCSMVRQRCLGALWVAPGGVSEELWGALGRPRLPKVTSKWMDIRCLCPLGPHLQPNSQ